MDIQNKMKKLKNKLVIEYAEGLCENLKNKGEKK
jgi:hypothetical protein